MKVSHAEKARQYARSLTFLGSIGTAWAVRSLRRAAPPPAVALPTERLLLRDLTAADMPSLLALHRHPEVCRFQLNTKPPGRLQSELGYFLMRETARQHRRFEYRLGIVLPEDSHLIGECVLGLWSDTKDGEPYHGATLGFNLHPDRWGRGFATEASREMLRFAFVDLSRAVVYGGCLPENAASARVLEKAGLCELESAYGAFGAPPDVLTRVFRADREDWLARSAASTADKKAGTVP